MSSSSASKSLLTCAVSVVPYALRDHVRRIPGVAAAQRWLFRRYYAGREFTHTIDAGPARGLRFFIQLPQDKAVWLGNYERAFAEALREAVRPGGVCYDIGGYRGFMAGVMALNGAREVVVFEPMTANVAAIQRLRELNPQLPIRCLELAVGDTDGEASFLIMPQASMGKLDNSPFQKENRGASELKVRTARLDSLLAREEIAPPKVVKIDVEGAELLVLQGATGLLTRHRPRLFIEAHTRELARACSERLAGLGYEVKVLETGAPPTGPELPEICHLVARHPESK